MKKFVLSLCMFVFCVEPSLAATVELDDIIVTDMDAGETITATLKLNNPATGNLTATSGNGETYTNATGVWKITSSVAKVNLALAAVAFIPHPGNDINTTITVTIKDAAGTGPLDGTITLNVTPVNNAPTATNMNQTKTYTEPPLVMNHSPTINPVVALAGAIAGKPFVVSYEDLLATSGAEDADGDPIAFRIEQVLSGDLRKE